MDLIRGYAASGSYGLLAKVLKHFQNNPVEVLTVDCDVAADVIRHLQDEMEKRRGILPWLVLYNIIRIGANTCAKEVLMMVQSMPACQRILAASAELLQTVNDPDQDMVVVGVLSLFMTEYACTHGKDLFLRRRLVCDTPGLTLQVIRVAEELTQTVPPVIYPRFAIDVLCGLAEAREEEEATDASGNGRDRYVDAFLRAGGMSALAQALSFTVKCQIAAPHDDNSSDEIVLKAIRAISALTVLCKGPTNEMLGQEHFTVDRNTKFRITLALHNFLSQPMRAEFDYQAASSCIWSYLDGMYCRDEHCSLQETLLFTTGGPDKVPLVVLLRQTAHVVFDAANENYRLLRIKLWADGLPAVAEALAEHAPLPAPDRVDKDRHCAFPGCTVTGDGLMTPMMKCGRCRAVYYCGVEHQRAHWSQHKKECFKVANG